MEIKPETSEVFLRLPPQTTFGWVQDCYYIGGVCIAMVLSSVARSPPFPSVASVYRKRSCRFGANDRCLSKAGTGTLGSFEWLVASDRGQGQKNRRLNDTRSAQLLCHVL